jgi:hypothetical protein
MVQLVRPVSRMRAQLGEFLVGVHDVALDGLSGGLVVAAVVVVVPTPGLLRRVLACSAGSSGRNV